MEVWLQCLLSTLAIWRLTHLISKEEGPWGIFDRLRSWTGHSFWGGLLNCFYCVSVWVSFPFACILPVPWLQALVAWWAFSGAAILYDRATEHPVEIKLGE